MDKNCTIYLVSELIGKKWTLIILLEIYKWHSKKIRFLELKNKIPHITSKILSERLKELEKMNIVSRKIMQDSHPLVYEYYLTKSGSSFIQIIKQMKFWALKYNVKNKTCSKSECETCKV